jgi:methylphosphotriester-DNA--protein-cysteine methyltransferase
MTSLTIEQAAWKCCRPAKSSGGAEATSNDKDEELISRYDAMVKFNYTSDEMDALLEVMSMISALAHCLRKKGATLTFLTKRYMHWETQSMLQERLTGMITYAAKNKKREILDLLIILRKVTA